MGKQILSRRIKVACRCGSGRYSSPPKVLNSREQTDYLKWLTEDPDIKERIALGFLADSDGKIPESFAYGEWD